MSVKTPQALRDATTESKQAGENGRVVYEQFILFGDSITEGDGNPELGFSCYQALQHDYKRRIDIVNRGFSGYNTSNALAVLPRIFPTPQQGPVRLVTLFFGANDASLPDTTGQHIPLTTYTTNLRLLIQHPAITSHSGVRILLITPPPIDEWGFDGWDEPGRSARTAGVARAYAEAVRHVGEETGVAVVDLWGKCMAEAGWTDDDTGKDSKLLLPGNKKLERSEALARLLYDGEF
ncbi:SGNH hydrolase [Aaosphaeria arxii CBS 175.79]|uniref:SGNH hydrolase n=1 Tax=Aaosphaeria arxii CBS 175.79 TaxID=1450172 RepID=A0A6A5XM85_9PLEO|nr:SGNH hydrolase [Aaosphaeria arxii CBS 175.79]KAF2013957.1 SGNH hydrolase [Aaosphaeria arxii CBS 175.79]